MTVQVTYTYACSRCEAIVRREYTHRTQDTLIIPTPPDGWQEVEGKLYCPRHEVKVEVLVRDRVPPNTPAPHPGFRLAWKDGNMRLEPCQHTRTTKHSEGWVLCLDCHAAWWPKREGE